MFLDHADEVDTAVGVGVATVHEAVEVYFLELVAFGDVAEGKDVLERRVYAAVRCKAHEVHGLTGFGAVFKGTLYFRVLENRTGGDSFVDFNEVLVYDSTGTDVEVADFAVAHLSVGQTYIFAACLKLAVGICLYEVVPVGG